MTDLLEQIRERSGRYQESLARHDVAFLLATIVALKHERDVALDTLNSFVVGGQQARYDQRSGVYQSLQNVERALAAIDAELPPKTLAVMRADLRYCARSFMLCFDRLAGAVGNPTRLESTQPNIELALVERVCDDLTKLRGFATDVFKDWPEYLGSLDGFDLQELGEKHGLLKPIEVDKPCRPEGCYCAEYNGTDGFPAVCYHRTPTLTGKPDGPT